MVVGIYVYLLWLKSVELFEWIVGVLGQSVRSKKLCTVCYEHDRPPKISETRKHSANKTNTCQQWPLGGEGGKKPR